VERLTHIDNKGWYISDQSVAYDERRRGKEVDLLAAYEDTGLTPEEIVTLQASFQELKKEAVPLMQAKIEERLVELPCKVGTSVWAISAYCKQYNPPIKGHVSKFVLHDDELMYLEALIWMDLGEGEKDYGYSTDSFGKIIFLTREEAEAALKEQEG